MAVGWVVIGSAIKAPLATSFAVLELLKIKGGENSIVFKAISVSILTIGNTLALTSVFD